MNILQAFRSWLRPEPVEEPDECEVCHDMGFTLDIQRDGGQLTYTYLPCPHGCLKATSYYTSGGVTRPLRPVRVNRR